MARKLSNKEANSQRAYLRSRALQDQAESRICASQRAYNTARAALLVLRGPGEWEKTLRVLKPEDIRGISERSMTAEEAEDDRRVRLIAGVSDESAINDPTGAPVVAFNHGLALGEGRRTLSWIWYPVGGQEVNGSSEEVDASECMGCSGQDVGIMTWTQVSGLNGSKLGLVHNAGTRNYYWLRRRCAVC